MNDLWKYDKITNKWTWMRGSNGPNSSGSYGTMGVPANTNDPSAREFAMCWTDTAGKFWMFGGDAFDSGSNSARQAGDLWKYDPSTNQWTWIKGDDSADRPGVYGVKGVTNATNKPGSRYVSVSWKDNNGNFWLFGGNGFDGASQGSLNDLWKYNPSSNQWTWIKGDSTINSTGVYGTVGAADVNNKPGARYTGVSWTDNNGDLLLFGGYGYANGVEGYLNDLWKYNLSTNKWEWIKGDNSTDQMAVYGMQGMPSVINKSGARTSCVSWTGGNGDLWLFGGYGFDTNDPGILNDLWKISSFTSPLPLQLLNFNGILFNDIAQLHWQTEMELNVSHFTIERSFDGTHFSQIGNVNASGNLYKTDYNFNDDLHTRPEQKIFYRLRMTDNDGRFTYSKIVWFDRSSTPLTLHIFPNPATNVLNLSFDQNIAGAVTINITDMNGRRVLNQTENVGTGRASINIDVSRLPSAGYVLSLTTTSGTMQQKLVIAQ